jgi:hypothetical protein
MRRRDSAVAETALDCCGVGTHRLDLRGHSPPVRHLHRLATTAAALGFVVSCGNQALAPRAEPDAGADAAAPPTLGPGSQQLDAAAEAGHIRVNVALPVGVAFPELFYALKAPATGATISSGLFGPVPSTSSPTLDIKGPAGEQLEMTMTGTTTAGVACGGESQPFFVPLDAPVNLAITVVCGAEYSGPLVNGTVDARCACERPASD